ncbi:hypothetical protein FISHEDRAFT_53091 [Fistulina hepatica ATCC 64428]|nr:hypothetical protein FISHEDRAFT_53091 [Fistulina hepatica ATCC 64428]
MSSRLASFRGPSTPSSSPVQSPKHARNIPNLPGRAVTPSNKNSAESTYHRKIRSSFQELRRLCETWEDTVLLDGLTSAKRLVDTRTELNNAISSYPDRRADSRIVSPKVDIMESCICNLDTVILKLDKLLFKMNSVVDDVEALLTEAHRAKGWPWVHSEALWVTWTLEKFVTSIPDLLVTYHRSLTDQMRWTTELRSHNISFEESRQIIIQWSTQAELSEAGWDARWEDLCAVEIDRWEIPKD